MDEAKKTETVYHILSLCVDLHYLVDKCIFPTLAPHLYWQLIKALFRSQQVDSVAADRALNKLKSHL